MVGIIFIVGGAAFLIWFWGKRPKERLIVSEPDPYIAVCESCGGEPDTVDINDVPLCWDCATDMEEAAKKGGQQS
jgi:hypothetical protein